MPSPAYVLLATFYEELFKPLVLRSRSPAYIDQFRTAITWLAKVLARPPLLADLNRLTLETAIAQLARAGLSRNTLKHQRKKWLALWQYAAQLGWAGQVDRPPLPRPAKMFRPWATVDPPAGSLLGFYRDRFRPELRPQVSARELARYDCAINHFHDFTGRQIPLAEVSFDLLDHFRAWLDGLAMQPMNRRALQGALRRIMRAADPERFPKHDGADPRSAVGDHERLDQARADTDQETGLRRLGAQRLPEPIGEPGTVSHFWRHTYVPQMPKVSRAHYNNYLSLFRKMRQCFGRDLCLHELNRETIAELTSWLAELGNGANTIRHERARLSAVWRYAHELDQAPDVPRWRKTRIPRQQPDAWTLEEAGKIIAAAGKLDRAPIGGVPAGKFWRAILLVGWWTALRRGSLVMIQPRDIDLNGWLYIPAERIKNRVGKRFKLGPDAIEAVAEILDPNRDLLFPISPTASMLDDHFREILRLAGVAKGERLPNSFFHKWRRTVATHTAVRAGLAAAIALLGHSGPEVNARYIDPSFLTGNDATEWLPSLTDLCKRPDLADGKSDS